jgi:diketogulonate reductase-like aldo/keto reductase
MKKILIVLTGMLLFALGCGRQVPAEEAAPVPESETAEPVSEAASGTEAPAAGEDLTPVFDFEKKTVKLNSGYEMPITGLGTYTQMDETCINSILLYVENGGRMFDTAFMYGNEKEVGEGMRQAMEKYGLKREDLFVCTKIYPTQYEDPETAIEEALQKLDVEYIDLMFLHHPGPQDVKAYKALEKYQAMGKIHSIGLSNWYERELEELMKEVDVMPSLVQNEIHPYYQEKGVVKYMQKRGIVMECWYPLGGRGHTGELLSDPTITKIAEAHGVSAAQVILRWDLQRGIVVIPGSTNEKHIKENLDLYGFELSEEEMNEIAGLDRNTKFDWY